MAMRSCRQKFKCTECKQTITSREYLKCTQCDKIFDLNCSRDISEKRFRLLTPLRKQTLMKSWKCHVCNTRQTETPAKCIKNLVNINVIEKLNIESSNQSTPSSTPSVFPLPITAQSAGNIIEHNNYVINVPTENSFHSLNSETEEDDERSEIEERLSLLQKSTLNRSCPDLTRDESETIKEIKNELTNLTEKLQTANRMYNELLVENGSLTKRITEYELKINKLTRICMSSSKQKSRKKGRKNVSTIDLNINESNLKEQSFNVSESDSILNQEIEVEITNETQENIIEEVGDITHKNEIVKKKIIILADQMGREIRQILQKLIGSKFDVFCFCKPGAKLSEILKLHARDIDNLSEDDFIIVMGGMNDDNPFNIVSSITVWLNKFTKPNVIMCEVPFNKHLNETKLNYEYKLLCSKYYNVTFLDMDFSRYIPNRKQFSLTVSRYLLREVLHIGYKSNYSKFIKQKCPVSVVTVSTQTELLNESNDITTNKVDIRNVNFFRK